VSVRTAGPKIAFRHGTFDTHPRLAVGFSLVLLLAVSFVAVRSGLDWLFLILVCGLVVWLCASLAFAKVEIWESGFSHRSLSGDHVFEFARIEDALFETAMVGNGHPAPVFSVRLRDTADRKQIPIGIFPIRAAATLFTALERHGIQIREDGSQFVQSTMRQIREAQLTQCKRECC
jgi:hypothetical protein